jgi:hypothetical protein
MTPSVTVSRRCEGCGSSLDDRRSQAKTCSSACRQRVYRARRARRVGIPAGTELTAELRVRLRVEIDRRRREEIARQQQHDRALFAEAA